MWKNALKVTWALVEQEKQEKSLSCSGNQAFLRWYLVSYFRNWRYPTIKS